MKKLWNFQKQLSSRDPAVLYHNGFYYGCFAGDKDTIGIIRAESIDGLSMAAPKTVYTAEPGRPYSKQLWAPELHIIENQCYIYVACDDGNNHNHRMYVLGNGSSDPLVPYTLYGKITDDSDKWAIDGTVMRYQGKLYFIWSGWEGEENVCQNLYIAEMKNPLELATKRHLISKPEYDWEKRGATGESESPFINEGPYAFSLGGNLYVTYSGSGSWCEDYCIAALRLVGENPLDPNCWKKYASPIFTGNHLVKGAGHCSVIVNGDSTNGDSADGDSADVFFHAWDREEAVVEWNTVAAWHGKLRTRDGKELIIE